MNVFGVTSASVAAHYFPTLEAFSGSTVPTTAIVLEMITAIAAEVNGRLSAAGVVPSGITLAATPAAYAWCQDTVRLGAAVRATWAMAGVPPSAESWERSLAARYASLATLGYLVLGDAPAPATNPNGPSSPALDLDVGSSLDTSDLIPFFRRSDKL